MNKLCVGCNDNGDGCLVRYHEPSISECPCTTCLIKMACMVQCKERENVYLRLPDILKLKMTRDSQKIKHFSFRKRAAS